MKPNLLKCVFRVKLGKFLGFIVNHKSNEENLDKIKALVNMNSPSSVKHVQSLTRRIVVVNRFVLKSSDMCKEFFQTIKGIW